MKHEANPPAPPTLVRVFTEAIKPKAGHDPVTEQLEKFDKSRHEARPSLLPPNMPTGSTGSIHSIEQLVEIRIRHWVRNMEKEAKKNGPNIVPPKP